MLRTILAFCLGAAIGIAVILVFHVVPTDGRYALSSAPQGILVLDTRTGEVRGYYGGSMQGTWERAYDEMKNRPGNLP